MCGIFAVSGLSNNAGNTVLEGLKKLEYRGYDSWGIATRESSQVCVAKDIGKISAVNQEFPQSQESIGHTRWATHGGVTAANAHPHQCHKITVVHNGIFENYAEFKQKFQAEGRSFLSETDTEVIAHLIDSFIQQGSSNQEALQQATREIHGRFSLLVMFADEPGIYAARKGSPLILGRTQDETFIASDIPAFLQKTSTVNYLDDGEMVYVNGGDVTFSSLETGDIIEKRSIEVPWKVEEAEKGDYAHFMIKEIFDQKESIEAAINHDDKILAKAAQNLQGSNGVYVIACGTAHKVAMAAEYFFAEISGRKLNVVPASEMPFFEKFVNEKTALMAVSQSGETADVLEIFERAEAKGSKLLSLTNVESSSIARMSNVHIPINAGPEKAVASTKAATSQMALAFLLAFADIGKINQGREILMNTVSAINDMLNPRYEEHVREVARKYFECENMFIIGRGALYPMALEAAIKIQEVSYIHAQGFAAGELKHGPIALIEEGVPCVVLGDDPETISNATELKSRGAKIIGIAASNADVFDDWIKVPNVGLAQAIATVIPIQIFSYYCAIHRELDPDMPRNLAKSVTVK